MLQCLLHTRTLHNYIMQFGHHDWHIDLEKNIDSLKDKTNCHLCSF